jgi:hypothetical protein
LGTLPASLVCSAPVPDESRAAHFARTPILLALGGEVEVQVSQQGYLCPVVGLFVEEYSDDLAGGQWLPEMTGPSFCQVLVGGGVQPRLDWLSAGSPVGQYLDGCAVDGQVREVSDAWSERVLGLDPVVRGDVDKAPPDGGHRMWVGRAEVVRVGPTSRVLEVCN